MTVVVFMRKCIPDDCGGGNSGKDFANHGPFFIPCIQVIC
jgi:hypothetical protein